jgi:excinuclease ABC subunit B
MRPAAGLYPANLFARQKPELRHQTFQDDMVHQRAYFEERRPRLEAKRIVERTEFDLGNDSETEATARASRTTRGVRRAAPGSRPFACSTISPDDYLLVTAKATPPMPQIRAVMGRPQPQTARYGFRLPSAG